MKPMLKTFIVLLITMTAAMFYSPAQAADKLFTFMPTPVSVSAPPFNCGTTQDFYWINTSMRYPSLGCTVAGVYPAAWPGSIFAQTVGAQAGFEITTPAGTVFDVKSLKLLGAKSKTIVYIWATDQFGDVGTPATLPASALGNYDLTAYGMVGADMLHIRATSGVGIYLSNLLVNEY